MPLSEVAAGKLPEGSLSLAVRFSDGQSDLSMRIQMHDTVRSILQRIRDLRPSVAQNRIRLIHAGRLLTPGTLLHPWLTSLQAKQSKGASPSSSHTGEYEPWIHASIGPISEAENDDDNRVQTAQLTPLRGFDRLTAAGLTPSEIASVRAQFHARAQTSDLNSDYLGGALSQQQDDDDHARALEEQWIDDLDAHGSPVASHSPSIHPTFLRGLLLGFFAPLPTLFSTPLLINAPPFTLHRPAAFFSNEYESVDDESFVGSRVWLGDGAQRMGIACAVGIIFNIAYGIMRMVIV